MDYGLWNMEYGTWNICMYVCVCMCMYVYVCMYVFFAIFLVKGNRKSKVIKELVGGMEFRVFVCDFCCLKIIGMGGGIFYFLIDS